MTAKEADDLTYRLEQAVGEAVVVSHAHGIVEKFEQDETEHDDLAFDLAYVGILTGLMLAYQAADR